MSLIIPDEVLYNHELERCLERLGDARERADWLREFDNSLKDLDPRLSLVKASEYADMPGLTPGYWHVRRENDRPAMDSYLILTGPEGEFVEPNSSHLEWLKGCDLQRKGALEDLQRSAFEKERQRQRAIEDARAERVENIAGRIKVIESPGVSMTKSNKPWTHRAKAPKAA